MAYQVLARKYRPQRFSDVAGQDHVTRTLLNALSLGRIAHGYIFSGHRGIGKTTIARILAQALNCRTAIGSPERPTPEPCGVCESCTEIKAGNAVDVIEIDAATNRGIDEIRELRDAARYRPARDKYKIYILDEAHQITDAAFNALLKTLEEPPEHVVFMMATTQPEDFPQTIRSRCQHFSFHAVKFDDILAQLRGIATTEGIAADNDALALLAEAGDGSMRDALSIMDQAIASAPMENGLAKLDAAQIRELMGTVPNAVFERLMESISAGQSAAVIEELNRLLNAGNSPSQLARQFVRYLRNVLMARLAGENSELLQISPDERARAYRSAVLFSEEDLTRFLQVMLRTFDELNYRQEQRFHLELGLIKLVHLQRLLPVEELLSKLPAGSLGTGGGTRSQGSGGAPSRPAMAPARPASAPQRVDAAPPRVEAASQRPAESARPAEPAKPAFSPFEADRQRKTERMAVEPIAEAKTETKPVVAETSRPIAIAESVEPRPTQFMESPFGGESVPTISAVAVEEPPAREAAKAPAVGVIEPVFEETVGALALAPEAILAATVVEEEEATSEEQEAAAVPPPAPGGIDLDAVRDAVCQAFDAKGHQTASVLLNNGEWSQKGDTIEATVNIKKKMLELTFNAEAEKIGRETLRSLGISAKLIFLPGEGLAQAGSRPAKAAPQGSVQALAMDNPLVKQAQELFKAEVRSVLDLRGKN
ncbi:DNA polymerase III subunit gamma/tau [Silvibacterium acidisoli]|uniref:DNA polymerase III subunit gamma/tau n=1 Tax=Acidobacteriaceae bacterium ZG23-2 TaxID=2883246 RepID=UPI00406CD377